MLDRMTTTKQQELRSQIQRLKLKAFAAGLVDDADCRDSQPAAATPSLFSVTSAPAQHPRLKRRLQVSDDLCECERERDSQGRSDGGDEDEFRGPDGSFKLPRLMHPQLKRQHAVAHIKHEHETIRVPSPRLLLLTKPSRMFPCLLSRANNLRFVQ